MLHSPPGYAEYGITNIFHVDNMASCPGGTQFTLLGTANGDLNQGNSGNYNTLCYYMQMDNTASAYIEDFAIKIGASGQSTGCDAGYTAVPIAGSTNGDANQGNSGQVIGFCVKYAWGA